MTELVLEAGVDVNLKDNKGKIPLQLAREKGHTEIVELLRKHEAEELLPPPHERQEAVYLKDSQPEPLPTLKQESGSKIYFF